MINKAIIKTKIKKMIKKIPTKGKVYRKTTDKRGEPLGKEYLFDVEGYYYRKGKSSYGSITSTEISGTVKRMQNEFLLMLFDENTVLIKDDDLVEFDFGTYVVKDVENIMQFDAAINVLMVKDDASI
ncbi:hypothetical protein UT300013_32880 [Paraclostridium sordellii]|uniref:hypothetical protein n=1 Tax=Paraclostridium sordellii TaxID=1505 RepID=UPI0005E0DE99|nr:hypothetical protein [Paeniclostridium sordellii]CEP46433.1 Uncharacterised protein [[Clostridium] sordellii] [Paeniclostridium sordellii]